QRAAAAAAATATLLSLQLQIHLISIVRACLPSLQNILLNLQIVIIIPLDVLFSLFYPPIQH
ncbi:MAG: hypothetical protein ACQPRI_06355, partial [Solitalea-like symbiont of Tyrophagus putrescentiae]